MKLALITTTISVPRVLELYRSLDPDVQFFVAGDRKTPHAETQALMARLGNAVYYSDADQERLGYKCSEVIGWNKITRRNIALLEAMRYGADIIVTIDDDNLPLERSYFADFASILSSPYNGLMACSDLRWFNVGQFLDPPVYHRGFPYEFRHVDLRMRMEPVRGVKVGVAAGLCLGDPDIDAMERITNRPIVHGMSEAVRAGLVVDGASLSPFNSQNTAFVAELAPAMMMLEGVGRYQDIWAAYMAERLMMETDYRVHYGRAFVWQERTPQSQWRNLQEELLGMQWTERFCQDLRAAQLPPGSIIEKLVHLFESLADKAYLPPITLEFGKAWCQDVEGLL